MFYRQLKNELTKLYGKKRTYIGFGAFLVTQTLMLILFKRTHWQSDLERLLDTNGYVPEEFITALTVSIQMLLPQLLLMMPLYATLVGGDLVAKEAEDGTLRMILSRPISRFRLLLVKWVAGIIFGSTLSITLGATALLFARIMFPWGSMFVFVPGQAFFVMSGSTGLECYALAQVALAVNTACILSVAYMFSCFNMKPASATILGLSFVFMSMVMENIPFFESYQEWFITHHFRCWLLMFHDPIPWAEFFQSEIVLVAVSVTAFVIGTMAFQVRDIKS